jgi:ketosteroid isomerase-like protein
VSEENVEIIRAMSDAFRRRDWAAALEPTDPEIEMDTTRAPIEGLNRIYRGREEVAGFWTQWLEAWGDQNYEDPEFIDMGDRVIFSVTTHELHGRGSGIQVQMPSYAWLLTLREGRIVRATIYMDKAEAVEAAGPPQ